MSNLENSSEIEQLADYNSRVSYALLASREPFDDAAAELLLRNIAVATDRVMPHEFAQLSSESSDAVFDAANAAKKLVEIDPEDAQHFEHESQGQFAYRANVRLPLHGLQRTIMTHDYNRDDPIEIVKVKEAVKLAELAFSALVVEMQNSPEIQHAADYMRGNSLAAAKRLNFAEAI